MDILILGFFVLFCVITLVLLLRLLRKQGNSTVGSGRDSTPLQAEIEKWETRWKEDRTEAEQREANLRDAVDQEKAKASLLQADVARLEA